jgi:hypothetical protein
MIRLILYCEAGDLASHELLRDIAFVGRAPSKHIVIDHPTVSAQHALLLRVGASFWLKDLNSTNGTQINGALFTARSSQYPRRAKFVRRLHSELHLTSSRGIRSRAKGSFAPPN